MLPPHRCGTRACFHMMLLSKATQLCSISQLHPWAPSSCEQTHRGSQQVPVGAAHTLTHYSAMNSTGLAGLHCDTSVNTSSSTAFAAKSLADMPADWSPLRTFAALHETWPVRPGAGAGACTAGHKLWPTRYTITNTAAAAVLSLSDLYFCAVSWRTLRLTQSSARYVFVGCSAAQPCSSSPHCTDVHAIVVWKLSCLSDVGRLRLMHGPRVRLVR